MSTRSIESLTRVAVGRQPLMSEAEGRGLIVGSVASGARDDELGLPQRFRSYFHKLGALPPSDTTGVR